MTTVDWRDVPSPVVAAIARTETARWRDTLDWDLSASWVVVEHGRASGTLPGLVLRDDHQDTAAWTFFLSHDDALEIGAFVARLPAATHALLDAVLQRDEASQADVVRFFSFPDAPDLETALTSRGFVVERFHYLVRRPLSDAPGHPAIVPWRAAARPVVLDLFASAYGGSNWRRPFASHGRRIDWAHYLDSLLDGFACGRFLPSASFLATSGSASDLHRGGGVAPFGPRPVLELNAALEASRDSTPANEPATGTEAGSGAFSGVLLATALSPRTAHVAQVVVGPEAQGRGIGRALVTAACAAAHRTGFEQVSLLVGDESRPAQQLYAVLGFVETATFVSAARRQPRRSTIVALEAGGTRMRR